VPVQSGQVGLRSAFAAPGEDDSRQLRRQEGSSPLSGGGVIGFNAKVPARRKDATGREREPEIWSFCSSHLRACAWLRLWLAPGPCTAPERAPSKESHMSLRAVRVRSPSSNTSRFVSCFGRLGVSAGSHSSHRRLEGPRHAQRQVREEHRLGHPRRRARSSLSSSRFGGQSCRECGDRCSTFDEGADVVCFGHRRRPASSARRLRRRDGGAPSVRRR
jgi:hypothetical protein